MFKRIVPLVVALALLVPCLFVPVSAASLDYNDFISDIQVDGDNDLITVVLPLEYSAINVMKGNELLDTSYGTGKLTVSLPGDMSNAYTAYYYALGNQWMSVDNIPNGSSIRFTFNVDLYGYGAFNTPYATVYVRYFGEGGTILSTQSSQVGNITVGEDVSASIILNKPASAKSMNCYISLKNIAFLDAPETVNITFSMLPTVLDMSISSVYRLQEQTGKTNQILSAVEKKLEENGQKLDDIVNMPVTPTPPEGSDIVTDAGNKEDQLLQSGATGRDEFNSLLGDSAVNIGLYASSFAFLSACINPFLDIPWIMQIITISLGLGLAGFLLNLGFTDISNRDVRKSSNSKKSARKSLTSSKALTKVGDK